MDNPGNASALNNLYGIYQMYCLQMMNANQKAPSYIPAQPTNPLQMQYLHQLYLQKQQQELQLQQQQLQHQQQLQQQQQCMAALYAFKMMQQTQTAAAVPGDLMAGLLTQAKCITPPTTSSVPLAGAVPFQTTQQPPPPASVKRRSSASDANAEIAKRYCQMTDRQLKSQSSLPAALYSSASQKPPAPAPTQSGAAKPCNQLPATQEAPQCVRLPATRPATSICTAGAVVSVPASSPRGSCDEDDEEFIDVVGDQFIKTKAQRKAHIEFYRKLKLLRNRERSLQCALCHDKVVNNENAVRSHVTSHTSASQLTCKICSYSTTELNTMFTHMVEKHPRARSCYEDRRDMSVLCELLSTCFPRNSQSKIKLTYYELVQRVLEGCGEAATHVSCAVCHAEVAAKRDSLLSHMATAHHIYRCKKCKQNFPCEPEVKEHAEKMHQQTKSTQGVDYNISNASEALTPIFRRCFAQYLSSDCSPPPSASLEPAACDVPAPTVAVESS